MTDAELLRFGKDNRYMCSPYANLGKPPLEAFMIQLCEARAEWRTEPATTKRCNGSGVRPRLSALSFPTALLLLFVYLFRLHFFSVHLHFAGYCHSLSIR